MTVPENIAQLIDDEIVLVAEELDCKLVANLDRDTVLLESGLDSLGFAMLVVRLEEILGTDPFLELEEAVYPTTLGEFHDVYLDFFKEER